MKILKIKILSDSFDGKMIYPDGFLSFPCIEHIYCDELETGICWLVVLVNDEDISKIKDMTNITELTIAEAEAFTDRFDPKMEEVTDEVKIRRLEIMVKAGMELTDDEKKALDPNDPTPGIKYRKRFIDKVKIRKGQKV